MKNKVKMRIVLGMVLLGGVGFIGEANACHNGVGDDCPQKQTGAQSEGTCEQTTDEDAPKAADASSTSHKESKPKGMGTGKKAK
jgi:hypothetical protein